MLLSAASAAAYSYNNQDTTQCSALLEHPSPTPVGVGTDANFEDKADSNNELELPTYTR